MVGTGVVVVGAGVVIGVVEDEVSAGVVAWMSVQNIRQVIEYITSILSGHQTLKIYKLNTGYTRSLCMVSLKPV